MQVHHKKPRVAFYMIIKKECFFVNFEPRHRNLAYTVAVCFGRLGMKWIGHDTVFWSLEEPSRDEIRQEIAIVCWLYLVTHNNQKYLVRLCGSVTQIENDFYSLTKKQQKYLNERMGADGWHYPTGCETFRERVEKFDNLVQLMDEIKNLTNKNVIHDFDSIKSAILGRSSEQIINEANTHLILLDPVTKQRWWFNGVCLNSNLDLVSKQTNKLILSQAKWFHQHTQHQLLRKGLGTQNIETNSSSNPSSLESTNSEIRAKLAIARCEYIKFLEASKPIKLFPKQISELINKWDNQELEEQEIITEDKHNKTSFFPQLGCEVMWLTQNGQRQSLMRYKLFGEHYTNHLSTPLQWHGPSDGLKYNEHFSEMKWVTASVKDLWKEITNIQSLVDYAHHTGDGTMAIWEPVVVEFMSGYAPSTLLASHADPNELFGPISVGKVILPGSTGFNQVGNGPTPLQVSALLKTEVGWTSFLGCM